MNEKGMLLIISGPSGSGKGTIAKKLDPEKGYAISISFTSRSKRAYEVDGKEYFFCTPERFIEMRDNGEFLEHAIFCDNYYGTPKSYVDSKINEGKVVVLEIDVIGALQVKEKFDDAVLLFLMPPTINELERRLTNRNTETPESLKARMKRAIEEIKLIDKYEYIVINDEVSTALKRIDCIVQAELLKPHRNKMIIKNFRGDEY